MMTVFVDTNIPIDLLCEREPFVHFVHFVDLHTDVAKVALTCEWKDYEDAIQYMSAVREGADCLVTRNKKDFQKSSIPVYTIDELLDIYNLTR